MANDHVAIWGGAARYGRNPDVGEILVGDGSGFTMSGSAVDNSALTPPTSSNNMEITTVNGVQAYGFAGYCGSFYSSQSQANALSSNIMTVNNTSISYGVSVVDNTKITFANAGVYNIQFSAQLIDSANNASVYIWLQKNGTSVPWSNTELYLPSKLNGYVAAWNFLVDAASGDYCELAWASTSSTMTISANSTPPYDTGVPSIIITAVLVR